MGSEVQHAKPGLRRAAARLRDSLGIGGGLLARPRADAPGVPASGAGTEATTASAVGRPNVVVIMSDDQTVKSAGQAADWSTN